MDDAKSVAQARPIQVTRGRHASQLEKLGNALRRHRRTIAKVQWIVVAIYGVLLIGPVLLPPPGEAETILHHLTRFAQFAFWGVWWPFVILSVMLFGRAWCGLLCPEGTLTEYASRHGLGRPVPRWLRWPGWPPLAFAGTTIWGQLVSVYDYPRATLLILGGSTVAALTVGFVYGRGKRVWCRYLCPVSGVFGLLSRLSPLHFGVDANAWKHYDGPRERVDCAPLIDMRHMDASPDCQACGRCSGHRNAVSLHARAPGSGVLHAQPGKDSGTPSALLLLFGIMGVALGAFQWSASARLMSLRQAAVGWLIDHDATGLLGDGAPWWLLTHEPSSNDVFLWLDGLLILVYVGAMTVSVGTASWLALVGAARALRDDALRWQHLAMGLIPCAGATLFVGLSQMTVTQLLADGATVPALPWIRSLVLGAGACGSAMFALAFARRSRRGRARRTLAVLLQCVPTVLVTAAWWSHFAHR